MFSRAIITPSTHRLPRWPNWHLLTPALLSPLQLLSGIAWLSTFGCIVALDECAVVLDSVPNRPGRTAGPWRAIVPGVPGRVGTDGRARRPSFIKTAVLWVDGQALQSYWERDLPVGPGRHLDGLTFPTGPCRHLQGPAVTYSPCQFSVRPINC